MVYKQQEEEGKEEDEEDWLEENPGRSTEMGKKKERRVRKRKNDH